MIHAWWVPALGIKQDAIPGFVRDTWFRADNPGIYRGQCAELCGKDHGFMPIVVEAVAPEKYAAWVAEQKKTMVATAPSRSRQGMDARRAEAHGEKVYAANCVACHQATGMGVPRTFPALSGSKVVTGPKEEQINIVLNGAKDGKPTAMAPFKHLSDVEIAAVVTYTRNNWANKAGDVGHAGRGEGAAQVARQQSPGEPAWKQHTHITPTVTATHAHDATRITRRGSCAGSPRPITRTSARST